MKEKVAIKKSFEVKERPYANNKTDSPNKTEDSSFHNNTVSVQTYCDVINLCLLS